MFTFCSAVLIHRAVSQKTHCGGDCIVYPRSMEDDEEPTEKTPKALEIPTPKRDDVITNFKKAAQPTAGRRWAKKPPARPAVRDKPVPGRGKRR